MTMKAGLHREKLYCRVFNLHQTMYVKLMEILLAPSLNWKVYTLNCSAEEFTCKANFVAVSLTPGMSNISMDWRKHTWKYTKTQESNFCVRVNAYLECGFQCLDLSVIESLLKVPSQAGAPPLAT